VNRNPFIGTITSEVALEFNLLHKNSKKMKNYQISVGIVTGVLIIFVTSIQLNLSMFLIWFLFLLGPGLILWMVWSVLAAPIEIKETFEKQWYQDVPKL